jgi:hypothetical protein
MKDDLSHSRQCIVYEVNDICEKYKNYEQLNKAGLYAPAESIVDELREQPASIQVKSGWHDSPSDFKAEQFKIELSGGGPATRIIGELDNHGEVWSVKPQHQHWGVPWTDLDIDKEQATAVKWFASLFYYGE